MHDISLDFEEARMHGITGPSGSGKTLLMHLLGLLDEPDFGHIDLFGERVSPSSEEIRRAVRNNIFGYIFPSPCLLPAFTVAENVAMPLFRVCGATEEDARQRVSELFDLLGLEHLANDPATSLESDAQFIVALARALVHRPRVLLVISPHRPSALAPFVRMVVDQLGVTCLWSGPVDHWLTHCHHTVKLDHGSLAAQPTMSS